MSVFYLYVVDQFDWTYTQYGLYNTYRFVINIVGMYIRSRVQIPRG
jgi:hypothetical protein